MKTEDKAKAYAKKRIVLENRNKFSDEANLMAAEYYAYKAYLAGYEEAMLWRDPKVEPPTNQDIVLVKTDNNCYATAYYHGNASGFITYGEDAYVEFGEIVGWRPIE